MATSNSYNYSIDRDTLIRTAFENIGIAVEGEALDSDDITVAARTLNMMLKAWTVHGLQVWKRQTYTINPLVLNKQYYDLGTHETNTIVLAGDGATSTVTLAYHGYKTGDSVLIAGATDTNYNGTYTITVTDPSTFTYASTGSGADSGTAILQGANAIVRPERLLDVTLLDSFNNETSITEMTREEYESLPNKTSDGTPTQYHYERRLGAGRLYVWPVANATSVSDYTIELVYQVPIEDMDSSTDDFDFPQEWLEPISLGLAERLAPKYGYPLQERVLLARAAETSLDAVLGYDVEDGSLFLQPDSKGKF